MKTAGFKPGQAQFSFYLQSGGRGRTRTYEGIASGFTVRPLCRSGHSPPKPSHRIDLERQSAPSGRSGFAVLWGGGPMKSMEHASPSFTVCKCGDHMGIGSQWPQNPGNPSPACAGIATSDRSPRAPDSARPLHMRSMGLPSLWLAHRQGGTRKSRAPYSPPAGNGERGASPR